MKPRNFLGALLLALLSFIPAVAPGIASAADHEELLASLRDKGEVRVVVGLRAPPETAQHAGSVPDRERERAVAALQSRVLERLAGRNVRDVKRLRLHSFMALAVDAAALDALLADPDVASVTEDRPRHAVLQDTPGITRADSAWAAGARGAGQVVAILDTGIDGTHPFFSGKLFEEACFSHPVGTNASYCPGGLSERTGPGSAAPCPDNDLGCWHGTHVAGIAAGTGGIAPEAGVIAIQVFQRACSTCPIEAYDSDILLALDHVYGLRNNYNIAAVNMSLGADLYAAPCDDGLPAYKAVIGSLRDASIATVVAAGNDGNAAALSAPACTSNAISVGATTKQNGVSAFSNSAGFLSLLAPGDSVTSSLPLAYAPSGFGASSGTSAAAAHVAGAWAALKSTKPGASVSEMLAALQNSGIPVTDVRNGIVKPLIQIGDAASRLGASGPATGDAPPAVAPAPPGKNATFSAPAATIAAAAVNVALQANGGLASASSFGPGFAPASANNGDRKGLNWGNGGGWNDNNANVFPDWLQVNFNGMKDIVEIDVFTVQDAYASPADPTLAMTFTKYGITAFQVQYWNGSAWIDVPGGNVTGNNKVWRQFTFGPISTDRIRVLVNAALANYSRIVELEAWTAADGGDTTPPSAPTNLALQSVTATGATITWTASTDNVAVTGYKVFRNSTQVGTSATASFADSGLTPSTTYSYAVSAYDAAMNDSALSAPLQVTTSGSQSFQLSGIVTVSGTGAALSGVVMAGTGGVSCSQSDGTGQYGCTVPQGWTGTVTPSLSGYTFAPTSRSYSNVLANQAGQNYVATASGSASVNVALQSNGGVASASSFGTGFAPSSANNGDRRGLNWGNGGGWNDNNANVFPDWLQVNFNGVKNIAEIDVFTVQDAYASPADPTLAMTFTKYGITSFQVQYWTGSAWADVPAGNVTGNNKVWRQFTFNPISTDRIRVLVNAALANYSRIVEVEAWTAVAAPPTTFQLSGTISVSGTGAPLSGVQLSGGAGVTCTQSDGAGQYGCAVPQGWSGTITPTSSGYTFAPASRSYSNVAANQTGQDYTATAAPPTIALQTVAMGLSSPVGIEHAGDARLFIVQQGGQIRIVSGGQLLPNPFLNIASLIVTSSEQGLLGLAFHPNYAANGYFYVNYTRQGDGATVIARYQRSAADQNLADAGSAQILLMVAQPFANHNGGQLRFGPDGYLYIGLGDGGSGNDPGNRAQNLSTMLGKMLRIDVNGGSPYAIPEGNPYQNDGNANTLSEIWAYGLRNPWRFSFDRLTGDLFIADVGQSAWEEINLQPAGTGAGANYGWRVMEGAHCTGLVGGPACFDPSLVLPILEYSHSFGCSVTGGHRYRGTAYPSLAGYFVYGDYCSGRIWGATPNASGVWSSVQLYSTGFNISTFGEDASGEIYVASYGSGSGSGVIYRITAQ